MTELAGILSAFGLSSASGLNAYIPLLAVGIMSRMGWFHLHAPYDVLEAWPMIALLVVLLIVEMVVDKIPGADHVNDIVQTFIRPTAGAVLFAGSAGVITDMNPHVSLALGLILGGGVHGVKALARPVVNLTTLGAGAPVASVIEDVISLVATVLAILMPILAAVFVLMMAWVVWRMLKWLFARKRQMQPAAAVAPAASAPPVRRPEPVHASEME